MSIETKGLIKGHVFPVKIIDFIQKHYDENVNADIHETVYKSIKNDVHVFYSKDCIPTTTSGFIFFKYNGKERMMFYIYNNYNLFENLEYYSDMEDEYVGITKVVTEEYTNIWLGRDDDAKKIIREIIGHFGGGWIDDDDCDNMPYVPVEPITDYVPIFSKNISVDLSAEKLRGFLFNMIIGIRNDCPERESEILNKIGITKLEVDTILHLEENN